MKWRILAAWLVMASCGLAQDQHSQRIPVPSSVIGPQLIAWSEFQRPQPIAASSESQQQSETVQPSPNSPAQDSRPDAQTFTGTIVKDGSRYVLRAAKQVYELDDQDRAKSYEGKQVKVNGNLDAKGDILHVINIELIS